ncbi:16S rRNA (adenine(1518)-N(6)/adenine(1519)-N(6))-dimethyltransferase RsmA [Mycoplasmopsis ciconiae]|uniref:Ribosomal RNA small subunit methyltransferase A n=1 Tax=Mycoplasmopsis ciconiae TaxID=561067 RepID=A0ABU7ML34_9BACT|nr:16S rRNA (adenine(1518)-N(6)/adenine(1519)-N(6))-dimethyltransferase RsmA [Mycoplasmopsis ciconiae]
MKKNVYAKKKFGQNFLTDTNVINKIIQISDPTNKNILEIGPGRGALTKILTQLAKKVVCFEIDQDMVDVLNKEIISPNLQIIHQDFLEANINEYQNYSIIANIPYYITSDILFKIFEHRNQFDKAYLMVQKEVALRLVAQVNSHDYSKLTLTTNYVCTPKVEFIVKANSFSPAPKVDSAIISLTFNKNPINYQQMSEFFKLCFLARRKKLSFSLKTKYSQQAINDAYQKLSLDDNIRIQQLSLEKVVELFNLLNL